MSDFDFKADTLDTSVEDRISNIKENKENIKKATKTLEKTEIQEDLDYQKLLREKRKKRESFNGDLSDPMGYIYEYAKKDPRFEYRMVNAIHGRIEEFMAKGWDLCYDEEVAKMTGQDDVKGAICQKTGLDNAPTAYLMRLPKELFEEDKEAKARINKEKMDSINNVDSLKEGSIKITENNQL